MTEDLLEVRRSPAARRRRRESAGARPNSALKADRKRSRRYWLAAGTVAMPATRQLVDEPVLEGAIDAFAAAGAWRNSRECARCPAGRGRGRPGPGGGDRGAAPATGVCPPSARDRCTAPCGTPERAEDRPEGGHHGGHAFAACVQFGIEHRSVASSTTASRVCRGSGPGQPAVAAAVQMEQFAEAAQGRAAVDGGRGAAAAAPARPPERLLYERIGQAYAVLARGPAREVPHIEPGIALPIEAAALLDVGRARPLRRGRLPAPVEQAV